MTERTKHSAVDPAGLYGQELEVQICTGCAGRLTSRAAVDVGAEQGSFAAALRAGGYQQVVCVEPHPGNASALRERFADDAGITVVEAAASDTSGTATLRLARDAGGIESAYHTLEGLADAEDVRWEGGVEVQRATLAALAEAGALPERIGLLKVDTEGHDVAVLRGLSDLRCDLVMVELWTELPRSVGRCPWTLDELRTLLEPRGLGSHVVTAHAPAGSTVQWGALEMRSGEWGNVIFVHDDVRAQVEPVVAEAMATAQHRLLADLSVQQHAAAERLELVERLSAEIELLRDGGAA